MNILRIIPTFVKIALVVLTLATGAGRVKAQSLPPAQPTWYAICTDTNTFAGFTESTNQSLIEDAGTNDYTAQLLMDGYWSTNTPGASNFSWTLNMPTPQPQPPPYTLYISGLAAPDGGVPWTWSVTHGTNGTVYQPSSFQMITNQWTNAYVPIQQFGDELRVIWSLSATNFTNAWWPTAVLSMITSNSDGSYSTNSSICYMKPGLQAQGWILLSNLPSYFYPSGEQPIRTHVFVCGLSDSNCPANSPTDPTPTYIYDPVTGTVATNPDTYTGTNNPYPWLDCISAPGDSDDSGGWPWYPSGPFIQGPDGPLEGGPGMPPGEARLTTRDSSGSSGSYVTIGYCSIPGSTMYLLGCTNLNSTWTVATNVITSSNALTFINTPLDNTAGVSHFYKLKTYWPDSDP